MDGCDVLCCERKNFGLELLRDVQAEKLCDTELGHGLCAVTRTTPRLFYVYAPSRCVVARAARSAYVVDLDVFVWPACVVWLSVAAGSHNLITRLVA